MNEAVSQLDPQEIWGWFEKLNAVPRPSKNEAKIIAFTKEFGESLGLETDVDDAGNVLIRKPATAGMENRQTVVLQAHLDMVHQKNRDTDFDFETQGIESRIDGEWVKANGTTLGADNGIGAASIMAVLASTDLEHGPIEGLFTIDEETGMTGAFGLQPGWLKGQILLNTDTEDHGELCIGCAGGQDSSVRFEYEQTDVSAGQALRIAEAGKRAVTLEVLGRTAPQRDPPDLWLLFAPIKKARTDFIVEKATELGVARIQPVLTRFTNAERVRTDRLQAHAIEAAEQCGGTFVPQVAEPRKLDRLLSDWPADRHLMFCDESRAARPVHEALATAPRGPWAILIGPEGGFSPDEGETLRAMPRTLPVTLGPRILRADTAAAAAITAWQMALGDW